MDITLGQLGDEMRDLDNKGITIRGEIIGIFRAKCLGVIISWMYYCDYCIGFVHYSADSTIVTISVFDEEKDKRVRILEKPLVEVKQNTLNEYITLSTTIKSARK